MHGITPSCFFAVPVSPFLSQNDRTVNITLLSAAYLYDSYGIEGGAHTVFANDAALAEIERAFNEYGLSVCFSTFRVEGLDYSGRMMYVYAYVK